eukprot:gene7176-11488_t
MSILVDLKNPELNEEFMKKLQFIIDVNKVKLYKNYYFKVEFDFQMRKSQLFFELFQKIKIIIDQDKLEENSTSTTRNQIVNIRITERDNEFDNHTTDIQRQHAWEVRSLKIEILETKARYDKQIHDLSIQILQLNNEISKMKFDHEKELFNMKFQLINKDSMIKELEDEIKIISENQKKPKNQ